MARDATGGLELALRDAVESFLRPWEARVGLAYRDGIRTEHWTRIKALTRRFANAWSDEYDNLRPASDLFGRLQEEISRWLDPNTLRQLRPSAPPVTMSNYLAQN
jgi:hypothetical protein